MHSNYAEQKNFQNNQKPKENLKSKRKLLNSKEEEKIINNSKNFNNIKFPKIFEEDKKTQYTKVNEEAKNENIRQKKESANNIINKFDKVDKFDKFSKPIVSQKEDLQPEFKFNETDPKEKELNLNDIQKNGKTIIESLKNENSKLLIENKELKEQLYAKDIKLLKFAQDIERLNLMMRKMKERMDRLCAQYQMISHPSHSHEANPVNAINPEEMMFIAQLEQIYGLAPNNRFISISNSNRNHDNMSYEELLALEERIGKESKGYKPEQISKLELFYFVEDHQPINKKCVICQNEFKLGDQFTELKCSHEFHIDCIRKWLQEDKGCPICKKEAI